MKNPKITPVEKRPSPDLIRWASKNAFTLEEAARLSIGIDPNEKEIRRDANLEIIVNRVALEALFRREMKMRVEEVPPHTPSANNFPDLPPIPENFRLSREKIKAHLENIGKEPPFFFQEREEQIIPKGESTRLIRGEAEQQEKGRENIWSKKGDIWEIRFQWGKILKYRDLDGLKYIHFLFDRPDNPILARALRELKGLDPTKEKPEIGALYDEMSADQLKEVERLTKINSDARVAVRNAITYVFNKIWLEDKALWKFLTTYIDTGETCVYHRPKDPPSWEL